MNVKHISVLALVLALLLVTSVTAFAQGNGPMAAEQAQGTAPQDGAGIRRGWAGEDQDFARGAMNFTDTDGDGECDNFVDEDGDGVCDNCTQDGSQQMTRRSGRSQDGAATNGAATNGAARRSGGQRGGRR